MTYERPLAYRVSGRLRSPANRGLSGDLVSLWQARMARDDSGAATQSGEVPAWPVVFIFFDTKLPPYARRRAALARGGWVHVRVQKSSSCRPRRRPELNVRCAVACTR